VGKKNRRSSGSEKPSRALAEKLIQWMSGGGALFVIAFVFYHPRFSLTIGGDHVQNSTFAVPSRGFLGVVLRDPWYGAISVSNLQIDCDPHSIQFPLDEVAKGSGWVPTLTNGNSLLFEGVRFTRPFVIAKDSDVFVGKRYVSIGPNESKIRITVDAKIQFSGIWDTIARCFPSSFQDAHLTYDFELIPKLGAEEGASMMIPVDDGPQAQHTHIVLLGEKGHGFHTNFSNMITGKIELWKQPD
jgi:hypothetical protein